MKTNKAMNNCRRTRDRQTWKILFREKKLVDKKWLATMSSTEYQYQAEECALYIYIYIYIIYILPM